MVFDSDFKDNPLTEIALKSTVPIECIAYGEAKLSAYFKSHIQLKINGAEMYAALYCVVVAQLKVMRSTAESCKRIEKNFDEIYARCQDLEMLFLQIEKQYRCTREEVYKFLGPEAVSAWTLALSRYNDTLKQTEDIKKEYDASIVELQLMSVLSDLRTGQLLNVEKMLTEKPSLATFKKWLSYVKLKIFNIACTKEELLNIRQLVEDFFSNDANVSAIKILSQNR